MTRRDITMDGDDQNDVENTDGRIPTNVIEFFKTSGGHSLLIRGAAGSGKTTLALEILRHFGGLEFGKYISSRISNESVLEQFPWLEPDGIGDRRKTVFKRDTLNSLEGLVEDGLIDGESEYDRSPPQMKDGVITMEVGEILPEMEEAYAFVEEMQPKKTLLIFDSVDGLSEKYGIGKARLMRTIQSDIVEGSKANAIFILEQMSSTPLDYLGDGVMDLSLNIKEGRIARYLRVEKMRGVAITRPSCLYSLSGGRFFAPSSISEKKLMEGHLSDSEEKHTDGGENANTRLSLSTTLNRLLGDKIFGGGVHLILGDYRSDILASFLETNIVETAISEGWGIAWMPSRKCETPPDRRLSPSLSSKIDGTRLRIFEVPVTPPTRFTAPFAGDDLYKEMGPLKLESYLVKTRGPYVYILDIPSLTTVIAKGEWKFARSQLSFFLSLLATGGHTVFCFMSDTSPYLPLVRESARTEIRVHRENGCYIIYGEKPFTPNYLTFTKGEQLFMTLME